MNRPSRALLASALAGLAAGLALLLPRRQPVEGAMPPAAHEERDVGFRAMFIAGVLMLLGLGGMMGLALWMYPESTRGQRLERPLPTFPEPQLQPDTAADLATFRTRQLKQLNGTWWIDRDARRLHLPIDQAMRDVARRGIPDWPGK